MQHLREIEGDNQERDVSQVLREVNDGGQTTLMNQDQYEQLKNRQDIRLHEDGNQATVLHRLKG